MAEIDSLRDQVLNSVLFLALTAHPDGDPPRHYRTEEEG